MGIGRRQGNIAIEYAVLAVVVIAALLGMSVFWMRALSGNWRQVGDSFGQGRQYEPGATTETRSGF